MITEMMRQEIDEILARYPAGRQRSGILPALYVIQREYGYCPVEAQDELAAILGIAPAEVGAVVGFYNMLHEEPKGEYHIEVCTNVPCMLRGGNQCLHNFERALGIHHGEKTEDGQFALDHMECLGSCGTAPMAIVTDRKTAQIRYFEDLGSAEDVGRMIDLLKSGKGFTNLARWTPQADPNNEGAADKPYRTGGMEPRYLMARLNTPDSHKTETYEADGGYETARRVLSEVEPADMVDQIKASGIRGRGGAGFPTGIKWGFLPQGVLPRYLVVNADESEPGTFKDRIIMEYDPHQLIEGIILSAHAIESEKAFIYLRGEYYFAYVRLQGALAEAKAKGYLGENIFGGGKNLDVVVHRGAGAYECGEETAQLSSLEGFRGQPRLKPPFPAVEGLYAKPTIVNNVESLCNVTHVMRHGVEWYKGFGTERSPGMRIFCLSGNVKRPGLYELPHATPLSELVMEGFRGQPRLKPPFPAVEGLYAKPTIVNNVESLCNVTHVMRHGVEWYKGFGTERSPGMRIFCLSGNVKRPGLYELPHATPLSELVNKYGGGPQDEESEIKAIVPGGLSMKMLKPDQFDTPLDFESVTEAGSLLGSAGVIAIDERTSMVEVARRTLSFYREESCGKCTPCREGTAWLEKILLRIEEGQGLGKDLELMEYIADNIAGKSFCPFGEASVWGLQSNLLKFRSEFSVQIESTNPDDVGPVLPIRPDYRPDVHEPSGLRDSTFAPSGGNIVLHDDLVSADD